MAASGNVRYSQLRSGDRSGTGAKVATVTGSLTTDKQLKFDSSGNVVASSATIGGASSFFSGSITVADFTLVNSGSHTFTQSGTNGILYTAAESDSKLRLAQVSAPGSTPWNFDSTYSMLSQGVLVSKCGQFIKNNSSGKIIFFGLLYNVNDRMVVDKWTDANTAAGSTPINFQIPAWNRGLLGATYQRISYDGTTIKFWISSDGDNWLELYSETSATFLGAPDRLGYAVSPQNTTFGVQMTIYEHSAA